MNAVSLVGALADEYWDFQRASAQLWNIDRGDVEQIEHWEDLSPDGVARRTAVLRDVARRADAVDRTAVDAREAAMLGAVAFGARADVALLPYARDLSLVAGPFNLVTFLTTLVPAYALLTRQHGRGYVTKMRNFPAFVDGWVAGLAEGRSLGRVPTARGVAGTVAALAAILSTEVAADALLTQSPPGELSDADAAQWRSDVGDAVAIAVRPALGRLRDALRDEVLPAARDDDHPGVCHLPGGDAAYAGLLEAATSTALTPAAVHEIGWAELDRLDDEYAALGAEVFGEDDPAAVRERLRQDPALQYDTAAELHGDVAAALQRAEAEAPAWFDRWPQAKCRPVATESGPLAFYTAPSPDGARGGTFFYNAGDPAAWSRVLAEVSTFHETIPGHHVQLALALEADLHPVLGQLEVTGYSEGWGLYAERLADEMALYSSPRQRLGMVVMDSLRAARLVVDTGLHALGWTRAEALAVMHRHTAQAPLNAALEVDRYIGDPGQATAYMIGRLEIDELRRHAAERLGPAFALPSFHGVVLGHGNLPLVELRRTVDRWIAAAEDPNANEPNR